MPEADDQLVSQHLGSTLHRQQLESQSMTTMSSDQVATQTQSLLSKHTIQLGSLLWFLSHADSLMSDLRFTKSSVGPKDEFQPQSCEETDFGREVGRDEIDWWINRKETDLAEFSRRAALALKSAQALKERSRDLKRFDTEDYQPLIERIRTFATENSDDIAEVQDFARWLHVRDPLAPSILFNYKVWGSTRMSDRFVSISQSAKLPEADDPETLARLTETVWGFRSRGLHTYVRSCFEVAADYCGDPTYDNLPLPSAPVVRRTAHAVTDECAIFFEFLRNSLRDVEKELEERSTRENRITSELFWRNFIVKARKSSKAESLTWDFKQTLSFWHTPAADIRRIEKTKFATDLASLANAEGGCLVVGVTDDRRVTGVSEKSRDVENLLKVTHQAIRNHFRYPRDICRLIQVSVPDDEGNEKLCFVITVAKACEPAAASDGQGSYMFPQRTGSGIIKADKDMLQNARLHKKSDTYEFLDEFDQIVF